MNLDELKKAEERKREAAYDPLQRWLHIQETITWAEANMPPPSAPQPPPAAQMAAADAAKISLTKRYLEISDTSQREISRFKTIQIDRCGEFLPTDSKSYR